MKLNLIKSLFLAAYLFIGSSASGVVILQAPPPAGGVPDIESFTYNEIVNNTDVDVTLPSGSDGLLLIIVMGRNSAPSIPSGVSSAGFTEVNSGGGGPRGWIAIYEKEADNTEASTLTLAMGTNDDKMAWYIRVSDASEIDVFGTVNVATSGASVYTIPEITTGVANTLAFYVHESRHGSASPYSNSASGWVEKGDDSTEGGSAGTSGTWGVKTMATAGLTGDVVSTQSAGAGAAWIQFSVK